MIDKIQEVNKNIDHIEHVEKFNPFHDRLGRFSSSSGMNSYSANPKTKAGAMAIQRSNAGGHGRTLNIHRESKGESITQNARWLATGVKPKVPAATSRAQYQQRKLRQQQAAQAAGSNQQQTAPSAQTARPSTVSARQQQWKQNRQQQAQQQQAQQQQAQQQQKPGTVHVTQKMRSGVTMDADFDQSKVAGAKNKEFKGTAEGKDLTKSFDATKMRASDSYYGEKRYTNQVADMQGFNSPAKKVSKAEFDQLAKNCGDEFYRTVGPGTLNGSRRSAKGFKDAYTSENDMGMNGPSGRVYGDGIYTASAKMNAGRGRTYTASDTAAAKRESQWYGDGQTTLRMTWLSKPNIVTESQLNREWSSLSSSDKARFGNHQNTYACAKGYDAVYTSTTNYMVVFNRSKVAVCDD